MMNGSPRQRALPGNDPASVRRLLAELVAINSVNPDLVPDGPGEQEIASYVAAWLADAGLEVEIDEAAPGRPSVVAVARGTGGGRSLMLNAHLDTVGVHGMADPFSARIDGGRLYGRGALDTKAGLAAIMLAAAQAARRGVAGDVIVSAVCDEEYASIGCQSILRRWSADACIVAEPTSLRVCVAHKGFAWARMQVLGREAHGSRPDLGADAIVAMSPVLDGIRELSEQLARNPHPLLGPGSVHASTIAGGQELSSYPASCTLELERRTLPGETAEHVNRELEQIRHRAISASGLEVSCDVLLVRPPFIVNTNELIVREVAGSATDILGTPAEIIGESGWMDSAFFSTAGIPAVIFGPAGEGEHAATEYAELASVATCARIIAETATSFCQ
jgi:acetylornithine deacetylase